MDDGYGITYSLIMDKLCQEFLVTDLEPGIRYSFKVSATNFNGDGPTSEIAAIKSCIAPRGLSAPTLVTTTATSVELRWSAPEYDGGCPI